MADDEKDLEAPQEEAQGPPLTSQEFVAAMDNLFKRAKAAGVRPLQVMAETYVKKGMGVIDGLLAALEDGNGKGKKR